MPELEDRVPVQALKGFPASGFFQSRAQAAKNRIERQVGQFFETGGILLPRVWMEFRMLEGQGTSQGDVHLLHSFIREK